MLGRKHYISETHPASPCVSYTVGGGPAAAIHYSRVLRYRCSLWVYINRLYTYYVVKWNSKELRKLDMKAEVHVIMLW